MQHNIIGKCSFCGKMIKRKKKNNFHIFEIQIFGVTNKKKSYLVHTKPSCILPFIELMLKEYESEFNNIQQMLDLFLTKK